MQGHFAEVDNLIAAVKAATVKNKQRRRKFNEIGSPSQPVLTRWGTWLNAVEYYAKHLEEVRDIVNSFEGNGVLVLRAKAAVNDSKVRDSLVKIQRDYQFLPQLIKKMENSKYKIKAAYEDITKIDLKEDCVKIWLLYKKADGKKLRYQQYCQTTKRWCITSNICPNSKLSANKCFGKKILLDAWQAFEKR